MTEPDVSTPYATVVIVAAGRGERFGRPAKVLEIAGGRPLLAWSVEAATRAECVHDLVIVSGEHTNEAIRTLLETMRLDKPVSVVPGGLRRQDSVAAGVAAVGEDIEVVLIHDGARPLASTHLFERCAAAVRRFGAAIVAIPVSDTLKRVEDLAIRETVSRAGLWAAQTPQGFQRETIQAAIAQARIVDNEFTDEASLLEALGHPVRIVPGEQTNIKVTHPEDLELIDALLWRRSRQAQEQGDEHPTAIPENRHWL